MEQQSIFEPKNEQPLWQIVFDATKDFPYGKELSYNQLESLTGLNTDKIQVLKRKVDRELKSQQKKSLVNIRGFGYKISNPQEQVSQAQTHEKKGNRQIKWASELLENMDTKSMTLEEKNNWMQYTTHLQNKLTFVRKKNVQSLEMTKKAKQTTQDSEKIQKESLDQLDYLMNQITQLKEKFS